MRGANIVVLVVALVLGGIAAFLARNWLLSRGQRQTVVSTTIVTAARTLPFGTPLTVNNVTVIPWAAKNLPRGAFSSKKELFKRGRRIALGTIEKGEPILRSKITGPGERASLSALLDKGMRAVTIRVDDVRGVAGFILPKDHVDVLLNRTVGGNHTSDLLLQDIKVIAVDQVTADRKDHPIVAKAVTLEVTPHQAQIINVATNVGRLSLTLRRQGDAHDIKDRRVSQADLLQDENGEGNKPIKVELAPAPPPPAPPAVTKSPPPSGPTLSTVAVVRGQKKEEYRVIRERPRQ